jgi:hypothetical protein
MQVINYSAVARYIEDEVKNLTGDEVDPNTIVTAIMRFSREASRASQPERRGSLFGSRMNLITDVKDVVIQVSGNDQLDVIKNIMELQEQGVKLSFHQFPESLRILTNSEGLQYVLSDLDLYDFEVIEGLAEVNIYLKKGDNRYDRVALLTDLLFRNGVHLVNAFYSPDEIKLVIRVDDASKAFDALRSQMR